MNIIRALSIVLGAVLGPVLVVVAFLEWSLWPLLILLPIALFLHFLEFIVGKFSHSDDDDGNT